MKLSRGQETELISWIHASEVSGITASHGKAKHLVTRLQAASGADAETDKKTGLDGSFNATKMSFIQ